MSRYIDADALEYDTEWSEYHDGFTAYSQMAIDTAPSIDIVFCKECKHASDNKVYGCMCNHFNDNDWAYHRMYADDFCSYGEREGE